MDINVSKNTRKKLKNIYKKHKNNELRIDRKHPVQNVYEDRHGVIRFIPNKIVEYLLDNGGYNINTLGTMDFSKQDWEQFLQLIGLSVDGWRAFDQYVSDEAFEIADKKCRNLPKIYVEDFTF